MLEVNGLERAETCSKFRLFESRNRVVAKLCPKKKWTGAIAHPLHLNCSHANEGLRRGGYHARALRRLVGINSLQRVEQNVGLNETNDPITLPYQHACELVSYAVSTRKELEYWRSA
jgi:hypothetical protein